MSNPYSAPQNRNDSPPVRPRRRASVSTLQRCFAYLLMSAGAIEFAYGLYLQSQNRTTPEDNLAWLVLGMGSAMGCAGLSLRFFRPMYAPFAALAGPPVAFAIAVIVLWTYVIVEAALIR